MGSVGDDAAVNPAMVLVGFVQESKQTQHAGGLPQTHDMFHAMFLMEGQRLYTNGVLNFSSSLTPSSLLFFRLPVHKKIPRVAVFCDASLSAVTTWI